MPSKPTVILVPGAWSTEHTYQKLVPDLERRGYKTRTLRNPSLGQPAADGLVAKDAAHLRSVIDPYLAGGGDVIVVAHSYAGSVLSEALADYAWEKDERDRGRVLGLMYIAAFLLPEGKRFTQLCFEPDNPTEDSLLDPPHPSLLYNDLPEAEQRELHVHLQRNPGNVGQEPGRGAPWRRIPAVYLRAEQDAILPVHMQQKMLDAVAAQDGGGDEEGRGGARARWRSVRVVSLDSSHSPMLSMPDKVGDAVALVEEMGREAVAEEGLAA